MVSASIYHCDEEATCEEGDKLRHLFYDLNVHKIKTFLQQRGNNGSSSTAAHRREKKKNSTLPLPREGRGEKKKKSYSALFINKTKGSHYLQNRGI